MKRLFHIVSFFFLGPPQNPLPKHKIGCAYQLSCIRKAWRAPSIGLYRILILTLEVAPFAFPTFWINQFLRKRKRNCVHFSSDVWVAVRIALLAGLLWSGSSLSWWSGTLTCYLIADIFVHVSRVVFLTGSHRPVLSDKRSLLLLLVNYGEIILGFAVLHFMWGGLNIEPLCPIQALYFSAVTSTTLGYGDVFPVASGAQQRVIIQLAVTFVFITAFVGVILGRLGNLHKREPNKDN